ncbi:MAG TPA: DUF2180 family protein [Streptomyces sp.]|nr:DUF2180 family protein [Streptomyces sp.]
MNCFECAQDNRAVPAVAVCRHCGTGVCVEHARVAEDAVLRTAGMGLSQGPWSARRVTCPCCRRAEAPGTVQRAV